MAVIRCSQVAHKLKELLLAAGLNTDLAAAGVPEVPADNWYMGSALVNMPLAAGALPAMSLAWNDPHGGKTRGPFGHGWSFQEDIAIRLQYALEFAPEDADTILEAAEYGITVVGELLDDHCRDYPHPPGESVWWKAGWWRRLGAAHFGSAIPNTQAQFTAGYVTWQCKSFNVRERA